MGITGLLPVLKSIQTTRKLSDFAGQTIAVDGYVWLHRGVYNCSVELATGKETHKYIDYFMHRVRMLRHNGVEPYIVFDGGPLPAKKGTENERRQKREESLARANMLAAQGKHSQARDHYLKCVDVTPEMAYQVIKALRVENVKYVVAPYEADAQMAFLERTGAVHAILTEDSDLLVFGCKNVLFKLDHAQCTVVSISRTDFASVTACDGVSLVGWTDAQFRTMAILSGCDYLPSIPGIGLKTAAIYVRKHKTAEQCVKAIAREGKKRIPMGYVSQFKLAEQCFLHQRVYDPAREELVHLADVGDDWTEEADSYVGPHIPPDIAKGIAHGEIDPETHLPVRDVYPKFVPRPLKTLDLNIVEKSSISKGKGKAVAPLKSATPKSGGILDFFGPNAVIPHESSRSKSPIKVKPRSIGKNSGKRTLAEVMDAETSQKKARMEEKEQKPPAGLSKYFRPSTPTCAQTPRPESARDSRSRPPDKENVQPRASTSKEPADDFDSVLAHPADEEMEDVSEGEGVDQEDGYISPAQYDCMDAADLSSPTRPRRTEDFDGEDDEDFGVEPVSSPVAHIKRRHTLPHSRVAFPVIAKRTPIKLDDRPFSRRESAPVASSSRRTVVAGPTLEDLITDEQSSDIDGFEDDPGSGNTSSDAPPTPSPETPQQAGETRVLLVDDDGEGQRSTAFEAVAKGWREKWSHGGRVSSILVRRETTVTPQGRRTPLPARPPRDPGSVPRSSSKLVRRNALPLQRTAVKVDSPASGSRLDRFRFALAPEVYLT
ncbi:exodeoxyribonuclease 1 [Schizophyllum commune]